MIMTKNLTCIICPLGCDLKIEAEGKNIISISGNTCPRGKTYAETEFTNPMRTVTTTVKCENGAVIPVKTSCPVPKDKVFEIMTIVNNFTAPLPIRIGDVIIKDVFGSDIVAAGNISE